MEQLNVTLQLDGFQFLPWSNFSEAALRAAFQDTINVTGVPLTTMTCSI